jgi:hypothetical protein
MLLICTYVFAAALPGWAGVAVISELASVRTVRPGDTFEGSIIVQNTGDKLAMVRVYMSDYLFFADGTNVYGDPGTARRSNAAWITASPSHLSVPPKSTVPVYYKGTVPRDDALAGTYWSMIMIEPIAAPAAGPLQPDGKPVVGVRTQVRFGVQIATQVGETGTRNLKFLDKQLLSEAGNTKLQLDLENTGQRVMIPSVWMDLYDGEGKLYGKFEGGKRRIYPTCSVRYTLDLSRIPKGRYTAMIVADNGDEHVMGGQYVLQIGN